MKAVTMITPTSPSAESSMPPYETGGVGGGC